MFTMMFFDSLRKSPAVSHRDEAVAKKTKVSAVPSLKVVRDKAALYL